MGQRTITIFTDDLTGKDFQEGEGESVIFAYRDEFYRMDLSNESLAKFEKAIGNYIEKATSIENPYAEEEPEVPRRRGRGTGIPAKADREQLDAMRTWLRAQGHEVSSRGRIAGHLQDIYNAAH